MLYCLWEEVVDSLKLQMIMFGSWSSNFFFFAGLSALTTGLKRVESLILAEFSLSQEGMGCPWKHVKAKSYDRICEAPT